MRIRLAGPLIALALVAASCATAPSTPMTERQICRDHYSNDPVLRAQCDTDRERRQGSRDDARPEDLPIRTGQPSD